MKLITSTHYNRPDCTKQMLAALSQCERIKEYHCIFFIEPGCPAVAKLIEESNLNKTIHYNTSLLGCWVNKKQAIDTGFESTDYLIHLEDDVLLSRDALLYFEWAGRQTNEAIATVTAYNRFDLKNYIESNATTRTVRQRQWYNSTAWAIKESNYRKIPDWTGQDKDLLEKLHLRYGMNELYPCLSRANNIGHCNGVCSSALDVLRVVGNNAYAPIGLSRNGLAFVSDKSAYVSNLKKLEQHPIREVQIRKCEEFDFESQLITNELGDELVKLDDKNFKSRNRVEYRQQYYLDVWAGSLDVLERNFEYDGTHNTI